MDGCNLPIEIFHLGPDDLTIEEKSALEKLDGVVTTDIWDVLDIQGELSIDSGWAIKPFAILASRFREVIFIDSDIMFLQNVDTVVSESVLFKQYGVMFFTDRSVQLDDVPLEWFNKTVLYPSKYARGNRFLNKLSSEEMESGVVVMDKGRTDVLHGLLVSEKETRDKDTYWVAFEMNRIPWSFSPAKHGYCGVIGYKSPSTNQICGHIFHVDENYRPFWWNGAVVIDKHNDRFKHFLDIEWWAVDMSGGDGVFWDLGDEGDPGCLNVNPPFVEVGRLDDNARNLTDRYVQLYKSIVYYGWREYYRKVFKIMV
ncbi:hypothetical protein HDU76_001196 [Blyttiomyces sp. JEL0837]|nr:hypothetical protein HDU76_001196 [Blyttiomyces sp. JEL0837]